MFLAASMSSNHFPSLDIENILHLFCFVLILQRFSSFFHFSTSDSISDNLRFRTCRLAVAMFLAASISSNHFPSLDIENVLHLFGFVLILQRFSSFFHLPTSDSTSDNLRFPSCRLAEAMFPAASMSAWMLRMFFIYFVLS